MRSVNDGSALLIEFLQEVHDGNFALNVNTNGWFVQKQNFRLIENSDRQVDSAFHSSGKCHHFFIFHMLVGIDAIQFDVPKIFLPVKDLANARTIEPAKLEKGLGLLNMSFLDVHQDVITLAANAIYKLIEQEKFKQADQLIVQQEKALLLALALLLEIPYPADADN